MSLSETYLQIALIKWASTLEAKYPCLKWLQHSPNGERRDASTAGKLKAMGVRAGVLDLFLPVARGQYHGLMIELKKPDGKRPKPSIEQAEYMAYLTANGYLSYCLNDFEVCKDAILAYLEL